MNKKFIYLITSLAFASCTKTQEVFPEIPSVQFQTPAKSTFSEASQETVTISLVLSEAAKKDETINLLFNGSAKKDIDYQIVTPLPLQIKQGETTANVVIKIINDKTFESGSENCVISLSSLSNTLKLGNNSSIELTIYDGKALIGFEKATDSYLEDDEVPVKIKLDKAINEDIIVYLTGTSANSYYSLYTSSKQIIIKAGETSAVAYVDLYDSRVNTATQLSYDISITGVKNDDIAINSDLQTHKMAALDYQLGALFNINWNTSLDLDFYLLDSYGYSVAYLYSKGGQMVLSKYIEDGTYYLKGYAYGTMTPTIVSISASNNSTSSSIGDYTFNYNIDNDPVILKIVKNKDTFTVTQVATSN